MIRLRYFQTGITPFLPRDGCIKRENAHGVCLLYTVGGKKIMREI